MIKKILPKNVIVKDDVWFVRRSYQDSNGKRKQIWRKCAIQTEQHAAKILAEIDAEIQRKNNPLLFQTLALKFQAEKAIHLKSARILVRQIKTLINFFGESDLRDITFNDIEKFKQMRLSTPVVCKFTTKSRSVRTVHYELSTLRQIFNFAVRERLLDRSPFQNGQGLIQPHRDNKRYVTISDAEQAALVENCTTDYLRVIVILALDAGLRRNEILTLVWQDLDFENGLIHLKAENTKTYQRRLVPMTRRVREILTGWKEKSTGSNLFEIKEFKRSWTSLRKSINREDLHFHDLRHCFATKLHKKGVPIATISKLLGHASIQTTQIYINPSNDELFEAIAVLN